MEKKQIQENEKKGGVKVNEKKDEVKGDKKINEKVKNISKKNKS